MNLIAYSDSESEGEAQPAPKSIPKTAPKPSFQKVVDRTNPGRIKLNLPGASQPKDDKDEIQDEAPPAKKPRLGGGGAFGGFNAMLPAPKRANAQVAAENAGSGKRGLGKGLAAGVSLKTGAEPAFQRESRPRPTTDESGNGPMKTEDFRSMLNLTKPRTEEKKEVNKTPALPVATEGAQPTPKPAAARFVPMSVGKGKKKKPSAPRPTPSEATVDGGSSKAGIQPAKALENPLPPAKPKVSLFGVAQEEDSIIYPAEDDYSYLQDTEGQGNATNQEYGLSSAQAPLPSHATVTTGAGSNDLTNIAQELNLSEAERRQLFGKKGRDGPEASSARIVEFNTDAEYAHNEHLRQQGEQIQHNPLKAISGSGKNNLRTLVNVATTNKDALEDHFAAGYRNKKEAGNRYGW